MTDRVFSLKDRPLAFARSPWFSPHAALMLLLFLAAGWLGYVMLPGEEERVAMLERDGRKVEALKVIEKLYSEGDRSQRVIFQLQDYYLYSGDLAKARAMLETLAKERPTDAAVQQRLADFYRDTQDEAAYTSALKKRLALRFSEPSCRELIGLFRRQGAFGEEEATIERCRQAGYRRAEDLVRLAELEAAAGKLAPAANLMRNVDDLRRLRSEQQRIELFAYLIALDQTADASRRAVRWLKATPDDAFALTLIEFLIDHGRHDLALDLARNVGEPGSPVALSVAELMIDQGQTGAAQSYLKGWFEQAKGADTEVASRFINSSLDVDDPGLALLGARRFGFAIVPQTDLATLLSALLSRGLETEAREVRSHLEDSTIAADPVLTAAYSPPSMASLPSDAAPAPGSIRNTEALSKINLRNLDAWRLALWARLSERAGQKALVTTQLRRLESQRWRDIAQSKHPAIARRLRKTDRLKYRKSAPQLPDSPLAKSKAGKQTPASEAPFGLTILSPP